MADKRSRKEYILAVVSDLASDFMYYDRKEDEDLPLDAIEDAIYNDEIDLDEIVNAFRRGILRHI